MPRVAKQSEGTDNAPDRGRCGGVEEGKAHMEERMMDTIVEIYNHMDDSDKDAFTLEAAEDMVEDQVRMDKQAGREPLAYDPQFFYDTIAGKRLMVAQRTPIVWQCWKRAWPTNRSPCRRRTASFWRRSSFP